MRRHQQHRKVIDLLRNDFRDLYDCRHGAMLTAEQSADLIAKLKGKASIHDYKHRVQFLVKGLEAGADQLGWDVVVPAIPQYAPRETSNFTPLSFAGLSTLHTFEKAFLQRLEKGPPSTRSARLGQLLVSAILFGGLHDRKWFDIWLNTLAEAKVGQGLLWLDMKWSVVEKARDRDNKPQNKFWSHKPDKDKPEWNLWRRWVADPLTAALIHRWRRDYPDDIPLDKKRSDSRYYRHFSKFLGSPAADRYGNINDLLLDATTRAGLRLPSFLGAYAAGRIKSVSPPPEAWTRLLTDRSVTRENPHATEVLPLRKKLPIAIVPGHSFHPVVQQRLLRELLTTVLPAKLITKRSASESREALEDFLVRNEQVLSPLLHLVAAWGIDLLTHHRGEDLHHRRIKSRLRSSTVRRYLQPVATGLLAEARECDYNLLSLDEDDLHDLYSSVVDCCFSQENKLYTGACLVRFHDFLVATCDAPVVDFSDISVRKAPSEVGVDANLISPGQFDMVKKVLWGDGTNATRLRTMQVLVAILGYRCGLRRREALRVQLNHVHGNVQLELLVRPSRYGYLKSSDSIRCIPLYLLLPAEELAYFQEWIRRRRTESERQPDSALLFCLEDSPTNPLEEGEFFSPIEHALRQISGDQTLRFHHLRHSFASFLIFRLVWNDRLTPWAGNLPFLRHPTFESAEREKLKRGLLGNHRHGRQALYAVSMLLGHAGPDVTLLHYVHLCDWLLAAELARAETQPPLSVNRH